MAEQPILFSAPMVRAILSGTKTQTRRAFSHRMEKLMRAAAAMGEVSNFLNEGRMQPNDLDYVRSFCPYGQPGDRLWVRETFFAFGRWETRFSKKKGRDEWHFVDMTAECGKDYLYAADGVRDTQAFIKRRSDVKPMYWKRPAIFMPRAASRILLDITEVRVERLQDISRADAQAEGCEHEDPCDHVRLSCASIGCQGPDYRVGFRHLWQRINGDGSWEANPWVWAIKFKRIQEAAHG